MKNNITRAVIVLTGLTILLVTGCNPAKKWEKQEKEDIQNYLNSIGDTVYTLKPSGLYYLDLTVGTGISPVVEDTVSIRYKVTFIDYDFIDSIFGTTDLYEFIVGGNETVQGLDEAVRYMKEGGFARLLTPSSLAYGSYGWRGIPGYSPLLWTIELVDVKPAK